MDSRAPAEIDVAPHQDRYRVVSIPASDSLFRHTLDRQVRSVRQRGTTLRAARRSLRLRYPDAELSCQRDGGIRGDQVEIWFGYRDGRAEAAAPPARWWDDQRSARIVIDATGRLVGANARCRDLLELPGPDAGSHSLRDFVSTELYQELCAESRRLPAHQELTGAVPLHLGSGRRLDVEFCVRRGATGQRFEVALRSLADRDRSNDRLAFAESSLGSVAPALQKELFVGGIRRKLGPGERLTLPLVDDAWVVLVTAGITRLYVAMDGFEPTLAYGNAGSLFGTHALLPSDTFLVGLQAVTPSVVMQLSARRVEELARSNAAFARAVSTDVQLHLREVVRSFAAHAAGNLRQRLAREIVLLSELEADDVLVPVTEQQLADGVGSIRESIGRSIGDLRRDGSIATTRHGLLILDKGRLRQAGRAGLD
jgi:CRP/FNR family cyclic AMP-dependent transcriptional regulator